MPEGPSLKVYASQLARFEGKKITESGGYKNPFAERITGKKILEIKTYGKYFIFQFDKFFFTIHLGLFGSYLINDVKKVNAAFSMHFGSDFVNFYVVNVKLFDGKADDHFDSKFDPFSEDFDAKLIQDRLTEKFPKKKIGDVLMNQDLFPGVGNVIRNEVLFLAKIHPESLVEKIPEKKIKELISEIQEFSVASVPLVEKKIWKSSSAVYRKEEFKGKKVEMYESKAIKRKTFFVKSIQKLYE